VSRSRNSSPGQPQPVGDVIARFLEKRGLSAKVEAAGALADWAERVGPQIASVTQPLRVNEGTLIVAVANSAWMMELNLMKGELMRHVNAGRGEGKIRQIVFVMAA
jgi:predicted nucleic acid-binding Zn ribbon protein